ncbi:hypothetical protein BW21_2610 [Burkholderia humptydooensis]|nr:hypothetical protein BW21_2610 [Burkholderia sp. 2002721687]
MPAASRGWFVLYTIGSTAPARPGCGPSWRQAKKGRPEMGVVDVGRPVQSLSAHCDRHQNLYVAPTCANRPMYEYTDVSYPLWSSVPFAKIGSYGGVRLKMLLTPL